MTNPVHRGDERQPFEQQRADAFALVGVGDRQADLSSVAVSNDVRADGNDVFQVSN